jgi:uncharacterized phage protein gp47/JayE
MPWSTPSLREVRSFVRDNIRGSLPGADASVPNSVLRVVADAQSGLCHLTLQYIDWLALQLLPDTAETEWLDRHGDIWLTNADGTTGRKVATLAEGTVEFTGAGGTAVPQGQRLLYSGGQQYEVLQLTILAFDAPTPAPVRAIDPGVLGNQPAGTTLTLTPPLAGIDTGVTVVDLDGGTDTENDDDLRVRVLQRIREPPMGGAAHDYVRWTLAVPGVTRAWCAPLEMGIGTVTVRFMCDVLRADNEGFPITEDIERVTAYLDTVRPVAVKDMFVVAPLKEFIDVNIVDLNPDTIDVRAAIEDSVERMLLAVAGPGQTIYVAWVYAAVMAAAGVISFNLTESDDHPMPSKGHMAVLGDIFYTVTPTVAPVVAALPPPAKS